MAVGDGQMWVDSDGELFEEQELTWDGEPLWSPSTVREGLFDPEPFEQLRGQLPFGEEL